MDTIKLLQLGDIHFDQSRQVSAVDLKDRNVLPPLLDSAIVRPLQAVFRRLTQTEVDGIAIVGDLTTAGDIGVYRNASPPSRPTSACAIATYARFRWCRGITTSTMS